MKIVRTSKKGAPAPPQITELVTKLLNTRDEDLTQVLQSIDEWIWPRSDLHSWVKVLNKFDAVLEEIISDYEVDQLQVRPFSPTTKNLVIAVLRFQRLLLENSTNRKIYSSYDRLNSLLWCSDLDIIIFALNVLLRPAQQYSAQASVSHALSISLPRLQSLCKRWPHIREHTVGLIDYCQQNCSPEVDALPSEAREVNYSFYKTKKDGSSGDGGGEDADKEEKMDTDATADPFSTENTSPEAATTSSGATQVHITEHEITTKSVIDLLADITEKYSPPDDERFELLCRIRAAKALTKEGQADRSKLVTIRLLAIAIFGHTQQEPQALPSLFLYEPDLISHIAELLQIDRGVPVRVQTAAIASLDSLSRYRVKSQEVLSAINAGVNHGILMALFRKTVNDIADPNSNLPQSFTDALLSWITYISSHSSGGNMIVGAGLIPLLIQLVENKVASRMPVLSKAMALVDNIMYGFPNAFTMFCNAQGVNAVVGRIEYEIDRGIDDYKNVPTSNVISSQGELTTIRNSGIKHVLRSMHRIMQSSGTSEGLRGLIDTSLLKSVQKIIEHRLIFGPSILPLAINILSTFVHNEPTSLGVIQEAKVPETFFKAVEDGLEASIEVIQAVSNALGALCLNEAGQAQVARRPSLIPGIFNVFTSEAHLKILIEKENSVMVGTSIDELVRHHPGLKTVVFESIKSTLTKIEDMGRAYQVPDDLRQWYLLSSTSSTATGTDITMEDAEPLAGSSEETNVAEHDNPVDPDSEEADQPLTHDNFVVTCMDIFGRFLEGLFQHTPHCRDFIHMADGLTLLGRLTSLPCLPYDFANSVASDSMVQVTRTIIENASDETLPHLTGLVRESLSDTRRFWDSVDDDKSKLLPFVNLSAPDEEYANHYFRSLVTLHIRVTLLADVFSTAGYAQGRTAVGLLHTLLSGMTGDIIRDLGALHRVGIWENTILNAGLIAQGIEIKLTPTPSPSGRSPNPSNPHLLDVNGAGIDGGVSGPNTLQPGSAQSLLSSTSTSGHQNARALKHLSHGLPTALTPFFQAMVKMFHVRRSLDGAQRKQVAESSKILAGVMVKHLTLSVHADTPSMFSYYTMMLGLFTILLVDERTASHALHTVQLFALYRAGGLDSILTICCSFMDTIESVHKIREDERTDLEKRELIHAYGGIKIALHLIRPMISSKALFESGQTMTLVTRDKPDTDPDYFEPHNFLVKLRTALLPIVQRLWGAEWLLSSPLNVIKSIVKVTLEMVGAEGEEVGDVTTNISSVVREIPPRVTVPDAENVRMLIEMGFPRHAAERALIRVNNNISAATELLLSTPFPLPPDPVQGDTPEAEPEAEPEDHERTEDVPSTSAEPEAAEEASNPEPEEVAPANPGKSSEQWKKDLDELREPLRTGLSRKALLLIDEHISLLFDLRVVFVRPNNTHHKQATQELVDDIKQFSPGAYDVQEQPLANRCRLLALVLSESPSMLDQETQTSLMETLLALLLSSADHPDHPPKWLASHLLVTEALFTLSAEPRSITLPKEGEPVEPQILTVGPDYAEARARVFDFCVRLLDTPNLPSDEFLSVLRLLVFLTRDHVVAKQFLERNGVPMLFHRVKEAAVPSSSSYIAIILRHLLEDEQTIRQIMQHTIKRYFSGPRTRTIDINNYLRSCSALALRSPHLFVDVTSSLCQLTHPYSPTPIITLKPEAPSTATESNPSSPTADMQIDPPQVSHQTSAAMSGDAEAVVHLLISELMAAVKAINESTPSTLQVGAVNAISLGDEIVADNLGPSTTPDPPQSTAPSTLGSESASDSTDYACFLMQCLTELLFSYESCKLAFLSYTSKRRNQTPAKEPTTKFRTGTLQFFLTDLITFGTIDPQPNENARTRINLCNWALSVIVALCVDNIPHHDTKEVSPDLVSVRKLVFEAISRAIKEPPFSNNIDARYGRLLAMADLCHRLLTVKVNNTSRKQTDESPTHIAKIMLEKNFVATLTNALSEIDLNYPNVRGLVPSILRPLEHLTKIAIRMSRASGKGKEILEDSKSDSESSYDSDMDTEEMEESGREETPDLYRNSALGMYTGEMDDNQYNDSEMDESDAEDDDDVEMDFADETGSENTSNSDEEDEGEADDDGELWDEGDEEEDDLIQNEEEIDDDDEREIGEDEDGDEEELWQDVEGQIDGVRLGGDGLDDEEESHLVPIQIVHQEEHAMNPMGSDDEDYDSGDNAQNGFTFSDGLVNTSNEGNAGEVFIQRRRDGGNPATGRARNNAPPPVEITTHPLLMDNSPATQRVPAPSSQTARGHRQPQRIPTDGRTEVIQTIEDLIGGGAFQLFNQIMSRGNGPNAGFQSIRVDVPSGTVINVQRRGGQVTYTTSVRVEPRQEQQPRVERPGRSLEPSLTSQRWTQEVKILNGEFINDRLGKLANHVVLALLPLAIEALKQAKDLEAEQRKKEEEAKAAAEEEARKQQLDSEQNTETAPPPESIPAEGVSEPEDQMVTDAPDVPPAADTVMTDATGADQVASGSTDANDSAEADGSTSAARERITVMIHGSPVDITETGIDPTFLEALPDDMREEVLNQHVREQRAARVERPPDSQISAEFLDALPPEIRAEIIQQEAMQRAQQSRTGAPAEMDNASFFATLDPSLRQAVLSEQDEGIIQNLPSHILAEVGDTNWRQRQASHPQSTAQTAPQPPQPISKKAAPSHDAIQLLDRTGVAVLVRLLFFPQVSKKSLLLRVLGNLSENAKTRTELFNLLLGILQDGSGDLAAIDRSFSQMSVKGSKPHTLKTPSKSKQTIDSWTSAFTPQPLQSDAVPDLIAQRCLEALGYVVHANDSSSLFFLTEHELPASLRRHPPKKGKGKEKQLPQTYYPIVLLLGLLDRQSLLKTPAIVESVVGLLAMVTRPLSSLKGDKSTEPTQAPSEPESGTVSIPAPEAPAPTSTITDSTSDAQNTSVPLPTAPESSERLVNTVEATEEKALLATPPQIPQSALRLIVNILTVGECSGRTFQQSLALIQHLSFIPDVRDIIAQELRLKAQEASHQLSSDLDELALALERPQSDHLASVAARFSPASSIQARLLRVLKTIDYMYSPRLSTSEATGHEDIDKVQVIYESFQFSGLWRRLGSCLSLIAEDPTTDHIATVLLPLIESLMVVCKYAGSKGSSLAVARSIRSPTSPRSPTIPSPESMEDLFVTFTDAHRKLLNLMVRNNPSLMSGSFSLLVHNPRVLDFDNKRNYFNQQLHRRPPHTREQHGTLQVNVRRARVFEDSFQNLQRKTGDQIKYGKLSVRFYQEEGVDAGGVTREWFQILARQMFDPNYALFQPCAADKLTYQPNKNSWVNPEHLSFFKFVGRIIGKAIYDGRLLDAYFARSLYRQLLGKPVDYKDVEWVDPEYYNSLCWILENDPTLLDLTFSVEADEFGVQKVIPLKENGDSIPVTQENKREFVQLSAQYRLYSSIEKQIDSLLAGFYEIVPKDLVAIFNEQELELLISGTPDIDVDEWRAATEYNGYTSSDPNIVWWWRALKSFNRDERAKVLSFATGTSRVPLNGFTDLQGVQGVQRFSIHKAYGEPDRLPQAHTCFNQIDLPQYTSYEMLRQQLVMAINEGGEGFAFS